MWSHRLASCQTQNDFMRDWLPFRSEYLHELLNAEGRGSNSRCSICNDSHGVIRCSDCFESPVFCRDCCLRSHGSLPFHRVQLWNGKSILKSSLFEQLASSLQSLHLLLMFWITSTLMQWNARLQP